MGELAGLLGLPPSAMLSPLPRDEPNRVAMIRREVLPWCCLPSTRKETFRPVCIVRHCPRSLSTLAKERSSAGGKRGIVEITPEAT